MYVEAQVIVVVYGRWVCKWWVGVVCVWGFLMLRLRWVSWGMWGRERGGCLVVHPGKQIEARWGGKKGSWLLVHPGKQIDARRWAN